MKHPKLKVEKRTILGKKIKKLRREGILPANVYGKDIKSASVQVPLKDFEKVYKEVGSTGLVDVELDGKAIPVLIHSLQTDYRRTPLHADFFKVNLKEKIKTMVPLSFVGEAKAVTEKLGLVLEIMHEVEVEALPDALPEKIEANVEGLAAVNDQLIVGDLKAPEGVEITTDPNQAIAKIGELTVAEPEPEEVPEEEGAEGEAVEGEAPAEGAEGEKQEEQPEENKEG